MVVCVVCVTRKSFDRAGMIWKHCCAKNSSLDSLQAPLVQDLSGYFVISVLFQLLYSMQCDHV